MALTSMQTIKRRIGAKVWRIYRGQTVQVVAVAADGFMIGKWRGGVAVTKYRYDTTWRVLPATVH